MKENDLKVYCKFDNNKESIDKVICKIFKDYSQNKNIELIEEYSKYYIERFIDDYLYKTAKVFKSDITAFGKYAVSSFATIDEWENYNWLDNYQNSFFDVDINVDIVSRYLLIDT